MNIGKFVRKIFGKSFYFYGNLFRSFFVDMHKVAVSTLPFIPENAKIIDIGGGDGELLNILLSLRPDISINMIDTASNIGGAIVKKYVDKVKLFPNTSINDFAKVSQSLFDVVLISDVIHHIPKMERKIFFNNLYSMVKTKGDINIIIKDIEPGSFISLMSYLADRYISGDNNVSLICCKSLKGFMKDAFGDLLSVGEVSICQVDKTNYIQVFKIRRNV